MNEQELVERNIRLGKAVWQARRDHTALQAGTSHSDMQDWLNRPWEALPVEEKDEYIAIGTALWNAVFKELDGCNLIERHELMGEEDARGLLLELSLKDPLNSAIYTKTADKIISGVVKKLYADGHTAISLDMRIPAVLSKKAD